MEVSKRFNDWMHPNKPLRTIWLNYVHYDESSILHTTKVKQIRLTTKMGTHARTRTQTYTQANTQTRKERELGREELFLRTVVLSTALN